MGRSLALVTESVIEDYDNGVIQPEGEFRRYAAIRTDKGVVHRETIVAEEGRELASCDATIQFAIGSGQHGRSYVINRSGTLFMSPLTWYSQQGTWDLSPGYTPSEHQRFSRRLSDGCLSCHAGRMSGYEQRFHSYDADPFEETVIGCERCHGPGDAHVRFHRQKSKDRGIKADPIVNPAMLEHALADSVCLQCHLLGQLRVPRSGYREFDFRPGDHLLDVWTVFLSAGGGTSNDGIEAVSQVEQLHGSRCYLESEGQLTCITCHDAHGEPPPSERVTFYRDKCLQCHGVESADCSELPAVRETEQDSCIACHLPSLEAQDISHTTQTDHRILRRPNKARSFQPPPAGEFGFQLFGTPEQHLSTEELNRAWGIALSERALNLGDPSAANKSLGLLVPLKRHFPEDVELLEALADSQFVAGRLAAAEKTYREVIRVAPRRETSIEGLIQILETQSAPDEILSLVERSLELNPWNEAMWGRKSLYLSRRGDDRQAVEAAETGLGLNPGSPQLHRWLSMLYSKRGDDSKAKHHEQMLELILGEMQRVREAESFPR